MAGLKLYGKDHVLSMITAMQKSGRFVHSYIITGDKGTGRKISAVYLSMALLCENGTACGECRHCRRILKNEHPDLRIVEKSKKNYSVDDVRDIVSDSFTSPNDCDRKVYIFTDCDGWSDAAQAALLKATEDPPDPVYFIFTGVKTSAFLGTLVSRSMTLHINPADRESCIDALTGLCENSSADEISAAADAFCGNIGRCISFLSGDEALMTEVDRVRRLCRAVSERDEYSCAYLLESAASDRTELEYLVSMFAAAVRDGMSLKYGMNERMSCAGTQAELLSGIPQTRLAGMYDACMDTAAACRLNCNASAAAGVLAARLCS